MAVSCEQHREAIIEIVLAAGLCNVVGLPVGLQPCSSSTMRSPGLSGTRLSNARSCGTLSPSISSYVAQDIIFHVPQCCAGPRSARARHKGCRRPRQHAARCRAAAPATPAAVAGAAATAPSAASAPGLVTLPFREAAQSGSQTKLQTLQPKERKGKRCPPRSAVQPLPEQPLLAEGAPACSLAQRSFGA